jgi:hypothetical protein
MTPVTMVSKYSSQLIKFQREPSVGRLIPLLSRSLISKAELGEKATRW